MNWNQYQTMLKEGKIEKIAPKKAAREKREDVKT
jgi:hypothetical protein